MIAIILVNMMVQAQEGPEIWMSYDLMPKKGMVKQFEAAVAKKNKKFNTTPETAIFTFKFKRTPFIFFPQNNVILCCYISTFIPRA